MCLLNDDQGQATNEAKKGEDVKDMLSGPMPIMPLNLTTNMMMRMSTDWRPSQNTPQIKSINALMSAF